MSVELMNGAEETRDSDPMRTEDEREMNGADRRSNLSELFAGTDVALPTGASEIEIRQVACDSRKVRPRALFFALHGAKADGNAFIRDAVARGAIAVASEDPAPASMPGSVLWIRVPQARKALAIAAANFFGRPANALKMAAV